MAGEDVFLPLGADDGREAIDAVAQIDRFAGKQDTH